VWKTVRYIIVLSYPYHYGSLNVLTVGVFSNLLSMLSKSALMKTLQE